jgi:RND superfamily putative drug exporter
VNADDAAFSGSVDSLVSDLGALDQVDSVTSYRDGGEGLVSADGHVALIVTTLTGDEEDAVDTAEPLVDVVKGVDGTDGFRVTTVGFGSVEGEITGLLGETLEQGELIGIVVALVILLLVFGAVVAAGLPIILALLSIFVAVGATALVSNVIDMSNFIVFIITMIGLAVGIDYSLFIVQRFREERARGREKIEAIATAGATASRTVFFSGMAVTIALAGMLIMPDPTFRSFALARSWSSPLMCCSADPAPRSARPAGRPRELAFAAVHRAPGRGGEHRRILGLDNKGCDGSACDQRCADWRAAHCACRTNPRLQPRQHRHQHSARG